MYTIYLHKGTMELSDNNRSTCNLIRQLTQPVFPDPSIKSSLLYAA